MKKVVPLGIISLFVGSTFAQNAPKYASTYPQSRNAILEVFTGIYCGNCPDGDAKAASFHSAYPTRSVVIDVHTTAYGKPTSTSHPDYRTPYGDSIAWGAGVYGYPSGMMNRRAFPGEQSKAPYYPQNPPHFALNRMGWKNAGKAIVDSGGLSPMNIGASSQWNATTRELTVEVEVFYTDQDSVKHRINVGITEDKVLGIQYGSTLKDYEHNHMLRDYLTGQWGELIPSNTKGSLYTKTFKTTLDAKVKIENANVVIFTTRDDFKWTYTGIELPAQNGTYLGLGKEKNANALSLNISPNPVFSNAMVEFNLVEATNANVEIYNLLGELVSKTDLGKLPKGVQSFIFTPANLNIGSGVYMLKLQAGENSVCKKIIVN